MTRAGRQVAATRDPVPLRMVCARKYVRTAAGAAGLGGEDEEEEDEELQGFDVVRCI